MTGKLLSEKRLCGDIIADNFIEQCFSDQTEKAALQHWLNLLINNQGLLTSPMKFKEQPVFEKAGQLPIWADRKLMEQGAEFFARHADSIMSLSGLMSLPYCYAAADGAMVLYLSDRLRSDAEKRLYETATFIWEVMAPGAFSIEGSAFSAILKVRLMHAAIRYYTAKSGNWNYD